MLDALSFSAGKNGEATYIHRGDGYPEPKLVTTIGAKRPTPSRCANMTAAYNQLHDTTLASLPVTDLYVRFEPTTWSGLNRLLESDLTLFDFPLDHEIIEMGQYYHDPSIPSDKPTYYYAVVKPEQTMPATQHQVLAQLYLPTKPEEGPLVKQAFEQVGLGNEADFYIPLHPDTEGGGGGPTYYNECGCAIPADDNVAAGCVRVWDTQLDGGSWQPVQSAKVRLINGWFQVKTVETTELGCFRFSDAYLKSWVSVWFVNAKATVRGMTDSDEAFHYSMPVIDPADYFGNDDSKNAIHVNYGYSTDTASTATRYWVAATTINAVEEWYDYAFEYGIPAPPNDLKILTNNMSGDGSAPMFDHVGIPNECPNAMEEVIDSAMASIPEFFKGIATIYLLAFLPDVTIGFRSNFSNSDKLKNQIYHELAHAVHYGKVGNNYWEQEICYTLYNDGYGNGAKPRGRAGSHCGRLGQLYGRPPHR